MAKTPKSQPRRTPEDWIRALIEGLLEEGPKGTQVTRLARRLSVTPGSFYWHFRDRDSFRDQALEYWRKEMVGNAAAAVGHLAGPGERLRALPELLVARGLPDLDAAMRTWASAEPAVADAVAKADEMRKRMLGTLLEDAGVSPEDAALRRETLFWAFLGSTGVDTELRLRGFKDLIEALTPKK